MSEELKNEATPETTPEAAPAPKPKRRWGRIIRRTIGVLALLLVIALLGLRAALPGIVRSQAETRLTEMLGVPVEIADVDLSLSGAYAYLDGFTIAQPEGFAGGPLLSTERMGVNLQTNSLFKDTIVIEEVVLNGAKANFRRNAEGVSNVKVLQENLGMEAEEEAPAEEAPVEAEEEAPGEEEGEVEVEGDDEGLGKIIVVERVIVEGIDFSFEDLTRPEGMQTGAFRVGQIELKSLQYHDPGVETGLPDAELTVKDFALATGERFENPNFFTFEHLMVQWDLGLLLQNPELPEIEVAKIRLDGMRAITEEFKRKREMSNIREFQRVAMGSVGLEITDQELYDLSDEDIREEEEERRKEARKAAEAAGEELPEEPEEEVKEEKSGGFLGLFGGKKVKEEDKEKAASAEASAPKEEDEDEVEVEDQSGDTVGDEGEESSYKSFVLKNLTVAGGSFLEIDHRKERRGEVKDIYVDVRDLTMPYVEGSSALITLRAKPWVDDSKIVAKLQGQITSEDPERTMNVAFQAEQYPMGYSKDYERGILDADLDLELVGSTAKGELSFKVQGFKISEREREDLNEQKGFTGFIKARQRDAMLGLETVSAAGAPRITVPIDFKADSSDPTQFFFQLYMFILTNAQNMVIGVAKGIAEGTIKAAGEGAKLAVEGAGAAVKGAVAAPGEAGKLAGEAAQKTGEAVSGAADTAKDAVGGVTGAVGGLLGGKKDKDDEKKDEEKGEDE